MKKLTPEQKQELLQRYADGWKIGLLADEYGITAKAVEQHAYKNGVKRSAAYIREVNRKQTDTARDAAIVEAVKSGATDRQVAAQFNITRQRVSQIAKRGGIRRPTGAPTRRVAKACELCSEPHFNQKYCSRQCAGIARRRQSDGAR